MSERGESLGPVNVPVAWWRKLRARRRGAPRGSGSVNLRLPNRRVQRTRSSASPPHSPLTRYPLGRLIPFVALAALLAGGCTSDPELPTSHREAAPDASATPYISTIRTVRLERRGCYGPCPRYTLTVSATGLASYSGDSESPRKGKFQGKVWFEPLGQWIETQPGLLDRSESENRLVDLETVSLTFTRASGPAIVKTFNVPTDRHDLWAAAMVVDGVAASVRWEPAR